MADDADESESPWESPVDHPGRKYEQLADQYDTDETSAAEPDAESEDTGDVPAKLRAKFWVLVLLFNIAIAGLSVGAMFILFESNYGLGSQLVAGGGLLFGYGLYRYRRAKRQIDAGEFSETDTQGN